MSGSDRLMYRGIRLEQGKWGAWACWSAMGDGGADAAYPGRKYISKSLSFEIHNILQTRTGDSLKRSHV